MSSARHLSIGFLTICISLSSACSKKSKGGGSDASTDDKATFLVNDFQVAGNKYLGYIDASWTYPDDIAGIGDIFLVFRESESVPDDCSKGIEFPVAEAPKAGEKATVTPRVGKSGVLGQARLCMRQGDTASAISSSKIVQAGADHRAFLTSVLFNGDLAADFRDINGGQRFASGLEGADARCQALGADISPSSTSWKAALSDAATNVSARIQFVGYVHDLADNRVAFTLYDQNTAFIRALTLNETGAVATNGEPWLGSNSAGVNAGVPTCSNWTSASAGSQGGHGSMDGTRTEWAQVASVACNEMRPLLCVEQ